MAAIARRLRRPPPPSRSNFRDANNAATFIRTVARAAQRGSNAASNPPQWAEPPDPIRP